MRSLINDATIESKKIGAYLCEESLCGAYLVLIALVVLARELFIPITGHYDKKYSSLVLAKRLVLKIMLYHLAMLLHDFVMMLHLFVMSFKCT